MTRTQINPYLYSVVLLEEVMGEWMTALHSGVEDVVLLSFKVSLKLNYSVFIDREEHGSESVFINFSAIIIIDMVFAFDILCL